jgi:hypothetical protein
VSGDRGGRRSRRRGQNRQRLRSGRLSREALCSATLRVGPALPRRDDRRAARARLRANARESPGVKGPPNAFTLVSVTSPCALASLSAATLLLVALPAPADVSPPPAPAPPIEDATIRHHGGFYLRMGAGVGSGRVESEGTVSGGDTALALRDDSIRALSPQPKDPRSARWHVEHGAVPLDSQLRVPPHTLARGRKRRA